MEEANKLIFMLATLPRLAVKSNACALNSNRQYSVSIDSITMIEDAQFASLISEALQKAIRSSQKY